MSDGALNGLLARLTSIEAQAAIVESTADNLVRLASHHCPSDVERMESHAHECQTLHSLSRAALHAIEKLCGQAQAEHNRRITDRPHEAMPRLPIHSINLGRREADKPLRVTFDRFHQAAPRATETEKT